MKKSSAIEKQIGELLRQRERVAGELRAADESLLAARKGLLTEKTSARDVSEAQATVNALAGALGDADAELARLRVMLREAEESERGAADAARVGELEAERGRLREAHAARLRALDEHIGREVSAIIAERGRDAELAAEIVSHGGDAGQRLGDLRWSDYGLKHGRHIAEAVGARAAEDRRLRVKGNLSRVAA